MRILILLLALSSPLYAGYLEAQRNVVKAVMEIEPVKENINYATRQLLTTIENKSNVPVETILGIGTIGSQLLNGHISSEILDLEIPYKQIKIIPKATYYLSSGEGSGAIMVRYIF